MQGDEFFCVPEVIWDLTTKHVLTTDLVHGETLDKMESSDQETRNLVCLSFYFMSYGISLVGLHLLFNLVNMYLKLVKHLLALTFCTYAVAASNKMELFFSHSNSSTACVPSGKFVCRVLFNFVLSFQIIILCC